MGRANPKTLREIAKETRLLMEHLQREKKQWFDDLCGLCGIASCDLFLRLQRYGYKPRIATNEEHVFVICGGYLVDVTATQFWRHRHPAVVVRLFCRVDKKRYSYWEDEERFRTIREINEAFCEWPSDQEYRRYQRTIKSIEKKLGLL